MQHSLIRQPKKAKGHVAFCICIYQVTDLHYLYIGLYLSCVLVFLFAILERAT